MKKIKNNLDKKILLNNQIIFDKKPFKKMKNENITLLF